MRCVDFHVDSTLVMRISMLRGRLVPVRAGSPVVLDDKHSFRIELDSAGITLTTDGLSQLLNHYVFHYAGAPLAGLSVSIAGGHLHQKGRLHGLPFTIVSEMSVTPAGELRLHPLSIHALGISVTGLMHTFGLTLKKLADVHRAAGVRIDGNDLLLTPAAMLPAPAARGHLVTATLGDSTIALTFRAADVAVPPLTVPQGNGGRNFMYFQGGTLRFGRLTMTPADLLIIDTGVNDPFDFFLDRYQLQLVAGSSRNTPSNGLITQMPDFYRTSGAASPAHPQWCGAPPAGVVPRVSH
ncbi:MAG TPA: hypothetical protein VHW65_03135 [Gemmatimonadales bacterium]|jgi:hypothetical protein|nr:hypothetical protein [Gemmatimonadales bacterium]